MTGLKKKKIEFQAYKRAYLGASIIVGLIYHLKIRGRENIPEGAALVCANHSSWADPLLIMTAIRDKEHLHMMAKKELFKFRLLGSIMRGIGSFPVDRNGNDIAAVKTTMQYLKDGEKVLIFPEGTRRGEDCAVDAKSGAVRIADRMRVPVLPIYIPRRKRTFGKVELVIGEPIYINTEHRRLTSAEYSEKAQELMASISALGAGGGEA